MQDQQIIEEIDKCLNILYESPSEKTVKTAKKLEELFKEYRSICCHNILKNAVNVSNDLVQALKNCGVIFEKNK